MQNIVTLGEINDALKIAAVTAAQLADMGFAALANKPICEGLPPEESRRLRNAKLYPAESIGHIRATLAQRFSAPALEQAPESGQSRFHGQPWTPCSAEHVTMVLAAPHEWKGYEVRYLYAAPVQAVPAEVTALLEALESMVDVCEGHDFDGAPSDAHMEKARTAITTYRAALAATPAADAPTGWKLVPMEPTAEMLESAGATDRDGTPATYKTLYMAMVGASPAAAPDAVAGSAPCTLMTEDQARDWAWNKVREDLGTEGWTVMDSVNYHGLYMWGWKYRAQYERQRTATRTAVMQEIQKAAPAAVAVPDERAAFEAKFRNLDLSQKPDAWGHARYSHDAISLAWEAWQARAALAATPAASEPAQTIERQRMTAGRASFFMERFLKEEKLLGPNEQAALHFVIDMLEKAAAPVVLPEPDAVISEVMGLVDEWGNRAAIAAAKGE